MAPFAVPGDRGRVARLRVEATNPLVVEVAEVECAVRSDNDTVWVIDLPVGEARLARPNKGNNILD